VIAYNSIFVPSAIFDHNDLSGLQGGAGGEYYHLTSAEYSLVSDIGGLTPTDGNFIVGNDATWVAESGNTARSSLGLGTGDSPTFADLTLSAPSSIYSLSHDSFADFVGNEHIDHTSVSISAGGILSGGGDISASRTISLAHTDVDHDQTTNVHQSVKTAASPTFAGLDLTGITNGNIPYMSASGFANSPLTVNGPSIRLRDLTFELSSSFSGFELDLIKTGGASTEAHDLTGVSSDVRMNDADSTMGNLIAGSFSSNLQSGTLGDGQENLISMSVYSAMGGGTCAGSVFGSAFQVDVNAGTIGGSIYGSYYNVDLEAAITSIGGSVYGLFVNIDVDKDPTGSAYGLYLACLTNVDYGIYQSGPVNNYLGGSLSVAGTVTFSSLPTGATQVAAGAAAGELWATSGHASLPDNVVMIGV